MVLLCILDGDGIFTMNGTSRKIKWKEIAIVNFNDDYSLETSPGSIICRLTIDYYAICASSNLYNVKFSPESNIAGEAALNQLKKIIYELVLLHIEKDHNNDYRRLSTFYTLLDILVKNFRQISAISNDEHLQDRMSKVLEYIHTSKPEEIRLNDIANMLYMSASAVSRMFLKSTGTHLKEYVRRMKTERVAMMLTHSNSSISSIAINNGYSSQSVLNRDFKDVYGITAAQYRKLTQKKNAIQDISDPERIRVKQILEEEQRSLTDAEEYIRLEADISIGTRIRKYENTILTVGNANSLESAKMQSHVLQISRALNTSYIRIWNIFDQNLMLWDDPDTGLNFAKLDEIFDFCVDHGMKLFLVLSPVLNVAMASETTSLYSRNDEIPFSCEEKWAQAIRELTLHISGRYGLDTVSDWIFEFEFYINIGNYYQNGPNNPVHIWQQGYQIIKSVIPKARIACPGLLASESDAFLETTVKSFLAGGVMPDIFDIMVFPYRAGVNSDAEIKGGIDPLQRITDRNFFENYTNKMRTMLKNNGFSGEIFVTDWGFSIANRNYIQDSCFRAAFIVDCVLKEFRNVDALGIFYASDLLNAFSDTSAILYGAGGILSRNGIRKPAFYAFEFLQHMGRFLIAKNDHIFITSENDKDIRIICYNRKDIQARYYLKKENVFTPGEIDNLFRDLRKTRIHIRLNTPDKTGCWNIHQQVLNSRQGDPLYKWKMFGYADHLSRSDTDYISQSCIPDVYMDECQIKNGVLELDLSLDSNEIRLIHIRKKDQ